MAQSPGFLGFRSPGLLSCGGGYGSVTAPAMAGQTATVGPLPNQNEVDALGQRTAAETARHVISAHSKGLRSRQERDLVSEKLLMHIDGSGDLQWADILHGSRVEIPRFVSEFRKTENVLRLVVDNAVAHHTTMPLRFFADALPDRRARDQAIVDSMWMNHVAHVQDLNGLFADAMYMAMPAGFCPVHRYWRDDAVDQHEPVTQAETPPKALARGFQPQPGNIDCWVGNPFDTVFDRAAKRGSVYSCTYGRVLPADLVRKAFDHVPGVREIQGTTRIPSAATFQRIARDWRGEGLSVHGGPSIQYRRDAGEGDELLQIVCREVLPGVEADWPDGRLQIVLVPGHADLRRGSGEGAGGITVTDQPLPGGDFSWTLFYSHHRGDDVLGKPWVEDIDQLQVDLNIALSKRWEVTLRMADAPIVTPGGALSDDMADLGGYNLLEVEPSLATWRPQVMQWPSQILTALNQEVEDRRSAIYTGGGYQASSRGEAPGSRIAYRAVVALQQADSSIHGPVNQRFRRSAVDFAVGCWKQMKAYGDVPWLIEITGDEYAHLVEPYIDNSKLSDRPPKFKLVNAFGPSPELRAQEVLELMATRGADGEPFLTTQQARRAYPNQQLWAQSSDPLLVQKRRAKTVATAFHHVAEQIREQTGLEGKSVSDPMVREVSQMVFLTMEAEYPRLRDDDLPSHIAALTEVTQDETADPIARLAAMQRQDLYYQWQAMMAGMPAAPEGEAGGEGQRGEQTMKPDREGVTRELRGGERQSQGAA